MAKSCESEVQCMVEPRPAKPTVKFVDEYCQWYQPLFAEVRSFEAFKQLHLGLIKGQRIVARHPAIAGKQRTCPLPQLVR